MPDADELLAMAGSDPLRTLRDGDTYIAALEESQHYERAVTLRALSLAARHTGRIPESISFARRSSAAAREGGLERIALLAVLTETGSQAISGDHDGALKTIEAVLADVDDEEMRAEFEYQRAAVLANTGHPLQAIQSFNAVLAVYERLGDSESLMMTLNHLGRLNTSVGDLGKADEFLKRALALAKQNSELASLPGIMHNIGLLASYRGEIPEALDWLEQSDDLYMAVSGSGAPQHVARAEVLISAGRFEEALETARLIADAAAAREDAEHESNALLVAARAALMAGRYDEASRHAEAAAAAFAPNATTRKAEAEAIAVEARVASGEVSRSLLEKAEEVVDRLTAEDLVVAAAQARFVAARIADLVGEPERARAHLRPIAVAATGPVEVRLQSTVARARLAEIDDAPGRAARAAANGLRLIDRYQTTLAATELRMGIEKHGGELAGIGLRHALESRRPQRVLRWLDRTRARALRVRPVTPTEDDEASASLADLRRVIAELRRSGSQDDRELVRRRRELERSIARAERIRRQKGHEQGDLPTNELIESLEDRVLYELGVVDGRLIGVVVRKGRSKLVELGEIERVSGELDHLRFAMRRAARRQRPLNSSVFDSISAGLLMDLRLGDGPVLVVPPPSLMSVPWAAIPALRGRELVVAPSAQMWWRAHRGSSDQSGVVIAGGPDLEVAQQEVMRVGRAHTGATVLPPGVGAEVVKEEIDGAAIAHIACHATFSMENPMFSSLRLGDGDLYVYDIERLESPPSLVVLSACDSGYTETRAGEELAGLTSALLSMGTRNVIASVGLVPDSPATSDLMVDLHKGLVAGLEPAAALAAAQERAFEEPERFVSAASFICVGA